jgi:hypothetical protein
VIPLDFCSRVDFPGAGDVKMVPMELTRYQLKMAAACKAKGGLRLATLTGSMDHS